MIPVHLLELTLSLFDYFYFSRHVRNLMSGSLSVDSCEPLLSFMHPWVACMLFRVTKSHSRTDYAALIMTLILQNFKQFSSLSSKMQANI